MSDSNDISNKTGHGTANQSGNDQGGTFLHRWSQRKLEQQRQLETKVSASDFSDTREAAESSGPQELPDIDTLDENSEVSMFFSEHVAETLRRQALRKLFHLDKFNVCDGLDDYAEDYTLFEPLGNTITAHQRLQKEREAIKRLVNEEQDTPPAAQNDALEVETPLQAEVAAEQSEDEQLPDGQTEHKEG